jgi:hypothetical protein
VTQSCYAYRYVITKSIYNIFTNVLEALRGGGGDLPKCENRKQKAAASVSRPNV